MRRLLLTLALAGSLAGGGAAIANAATSTTAHTNSGAAQTSTSTHSNRAASRAAPIPGKRGSSRHCPNM